MFIACQPKSASSAFARGLSNLTGIETIQRQLEPHKTYVLKVLNGGRGKPPPPEWVSHPAFPTISRIHPDTNDIPERLIRRLLLSETTIYKQAMIPTERHAELVRKYLPYSRGMIVLLRNPVDVVNAYKKHFSHGQGLYDIDPSDYAPAEQDHRRFVQRHVEAFGNDPRIHFVCYERLMLHPAAVMNECLEFWGFDIRAPQDYQLPRRRFTGQGVERLADNLGLAAHFSGEPWSLKAHHLLSAYGLDAPESSAPAAVPAPSEPAPAALTAA